MTNSAHPVALVTGSARRIGAHTAQFLHQHGYNILLHYNQSEQEAFYLTNQLNAIRNNSAHCFQADLNNQKDIINISQQAKKFWYRIDVLINNASSFYPTPLGNITEQHWDDLIGSNVKAALFLAQELAQELKKQKGCIINIIDIYAELPLSNHLVYCVAKAGLKSLTRGLAQALAPEVRVNGIAPGSILWPEKESYEPGIKKQILNEKTALQHQGKPDDIANTVLFLIQQANYITGQTIRVDGGRLLYN